MTDIVGAAPFGVESPIFNSLQTLDEAQDVFCEHTLITPIDGESNYLSFYSLKSAIGPKLVEVQDFAHAVAIYTKQSTMLTTVHGKPTIHYR